MKRLYYFFLSLLLGCGGREEEQCVFIPNVSTEAIVLDIEHFEDTLAGITSKNQLVAFLQREPVIREELLRRAEYPSEPVFVEEMFKRFTNRGIDTLLSETKRVFGDGTGLADTSPV